MTFSGQTVDRLCNNWRITLCRTGSFRRHRAGSDRVVLQITDPSTVTGPANPRTLDIIGLDQRSTLRAQRIGVEDLVLRMMQMDPFLTAD
jgi:hypothetical protein